MGRCLISGISGVIVVKFKRIVRFIAFSLLSNIFRNEDVQKYEVWSEVGHDFFFIFLAQFRTKVMNHMKNEMLFK